MELTHVGHTRLTKPMGEGAHAPGGGPESHGCTHALPRALALLSPGAITGPHPSTRWAMGSKLPRVCSRGYG